MRTSPETYVRFEDFLAAERDNETKHEWLDGVVCLPVDEIYDG